MRREEGLLVPVSLAIDLTGMSWLPRGLALTKAYATYLDGGISEFPKSVRNASINILT